MTKGLGKAALKMTKRGAVRLTSTRAELLWEP